MLRRFLEYFRVFKYNEYLSYSNIFINDETVMDHFLLEEKNFAFFPSFFDINFHLFLEIIFLVNHLVICYKL